MFWHLNPKKLKPFYKAYKLKKKMYDEEMWFMERYIFDAVFVAIDHAIHKKAKSECYKEPLLTTIFEEQELSQEELDRRELEKMLLAEEQWAINDKKRGLPETVIK